LWPEIPRAGSCYSKRVGGHLFGFDFALKDFPFGCFVHPLGAGEDPSQAVVVAHCDRLKLVVMATSAGDGQAEHRARHRIHAVFPFIRLHVEPIAVVILWTEAQKTQRGQITGIRSCGVRSGRVTWRDPVLVLTRHSGFRIPHFLHLVCRQLQPEKLVIGQIAIESIDDPFAIAIRIWIKHRCILADLVRLVFRVSR